MKRILLYTIFGLTTWLSCTPEPLLIDVPPIDPKIVVFSQFVPEQLAIIGLTRSFGALEASEDSISDEFAEQLLVNDAIVTLSYAGQTDTLLPFADGFYASITTPQLIGEEYTLRVVSDTVTLEARATMLAPIDFDSIAPVIERGMTDTLVSVYLAFTDLEGANWYMINYYSNSVEQDTSLNALINGGSGVLLRTDLISDQTFENRSLYETTVDLPALSATDTLAVSISHISEEYYDYLVLRGQANNLFSQITNEPINYPTNVNDGLGFFTTHFPRITLFDLAFW